MIANILTYLALAFTTVRRMTYEKHKYYTGNIGKDFKIVVKEEQ